MRRYNKLLLVYILGWLLILIGIGLLFTNLFIILSIICIFVGIMLATAAGNELERYYHNHSETINLV